MRTGADGGAGSKADTVTATTPSPKALYPTFKAKALGRGIQAVEVQFHQYLWNLF